MRGGIRSLVRCTHKHTVLRQSNPKLQKNILQPLSVMAMGTTLEPLTFPAFLHGCCFFRYFFFFDSLFSCCCCSRSSYFWGQRSVARFSVLGMITCWKQMCIFATRRNIHTIFCVESRNWGHWVHGIGSAHTSSCAVQLMSMQDVCEPDGLCLCVCVRDYTTLILWRCVPSACSRCAKFLKSCGALGNVQSGPARMCGTLVWRYMW